MSSPADLTLVELLPLLTARTLSARELVEDCLARVDRHEATVRAFVVLTPDLARAAADRADRARATGLPVGPLAGVPVALKDLCCTRGVPTTASSRVLAGHDPGLDAAVWERLSAAGAGLMGKTALYEFAYGTGSSATTNPWDATRTPGGSSGGSAAALAARMAPVAIGTDTGGSLRLPSSACGGSSLRPAHGRVSTFGVLPLAPSLDTVGPMARRMLDVALLLRLLAGHDPREPGSLDAAVPGYPDRAPDDLTGVRIGVPGGVFRDGADPDVARVCAAGLARLERMGAELVGVRLPPGTDEVMSVPGAYGTVVGFEAAQVHRRWLAEVPERYGEQVLGRLREAQRVTAEQYAQAQRTRRRWTAAWREAFTALRLDAVAHPSDLRPPSVQPGPLPSVSPGKAWSLTGFPALTVPAGLDGRGLPVGLTLAAPPEQEAALVGLGVALDEDVQLWRRNPLDTAGRLTT